MPSGDQGIPHFKQSSGKGIGIRVIEENVVGGQTGRGNRQQNRQQTAKPKTDMRFAVSK
jgi:hypothetical protein